jgi:polyferredoxin
MLVSLLLRPTLEVSILRDRNPLFVTLSDGSIRNGYTLRILNKTHEGRDYVVDLVGIDGAEVSAVGAAAAEAGRPVVRVGPDAVGTFRVLVQAPRASLRHEATDVTFVLRDRATQATASHDSVFRGPGK